MGRWMLLRLARTSSGRNRASTACVGDRVDCRKSSVSPQCGVGRTKIKNAVQIFFARDLRESSWREGKVKSLLA